MLPGKKAGGVIMRDNIYIKPGSLRTGLAVGRKEGRVAGRGNGGRGGGGCGNCGDNGGSGDSGG